MNSQLPNDNGFNFDIRAAIRLVANNWKLFVILTILGGILLGAFDLYQQKTIASAVIYVNQDKLSGQLTSDKNKSIVANKLGIPEETMTEVQVQIDKSNSYLIKLSSSSSKIQENINYINTWADVIVEEAKNFQYQDTIERVENARLTFETANNKLISFLSDNNLMHLSFPQLAEIAGVDLTPSTYIYMDTKTELPQLTENKLQELAVLMNERLVTQHSYSNISGNTNILLYNFKTFEPYIVESAKKADISLKSLLTNAILGGLAVFILTLAVILITDWWKQVPEENLQNPNTDKNI
ncbi:MAG: hypothetical protein JXC36_03110 [Candidatus Atribacteria bacterium]|nr:hypothetical protein [Candidatus Atribacteria bacterium]